ncbi:MAG: hypothetical protein IE916_11960 [Epsilonproteobacteria bacterium]|nr:hypothetical protein [Campylobacterota bacterium]
MSANKKAIDNAKRLRYVRILERFHKSVIAYLSSTQELTFEGYAKKIASNMKHLERTEQSQLYKGDLQDLEELIERMIAYSKSENDIEEIKEDILYRANQLEKTKNARRYKKEKHASDIYKDWE